MSGITKTVRTASLKVSYEETGAANGQTVFLLHGFPYDVRQYDELRRKIEFLQLRIITPYLRGFGPTRYLSSDAFRSGQQAALGKDVVDLMDALAVDRAVLVGYDWGGRAACVAAALWPERVYGLVTSGYTIQDIAKSARTPKPAEQEHQLWYQWYFQQERGRLGLEQNRREICKLLWSLWSPTWRFSEAEHSTTATSFENADFVATAIQSYRHRYGNAPGDPALQALEDRLSSQPKINVPAITLHGDSDQVEPVSAIDDDASHFTGQYDRRILPGVGHCLPAEAPVETAQAIHDLLRMSSRKI